MKYPHSPIEPTSQKRATEQLAKISVIGPIIESQRPSIVDIGGKLLRESLTKFFDRDL